jgi:hypothetical protein
MVEVVATNPANRNLTKLVAMAAAAGALVLGGVACGPTGDHLLGDNGLGGGNGGSGNGGGGWGGGSTYNADGGPQAPLQQQLFQALEPTLSQKCGGACHVDGATLNAPKWLAGPDDYTTITSYPGIVTEDVYSSKLLNRPSNHPASCLLDPGNEALLAQVTTWLTAEASAIAAIPLPSSDPVDPSTGSVDLSKAATGISGAKITFTATPMGGLMKFENVMLVAPGSTGIHILSPIFTMVPASGPEVDNTDFSTTEMSIASGTSSQISPVFYFTGWVSGSKLKIQFSKIEAATVAGSDGGTTQTACKDLNTFTNSAAPTLKNQCVSCHGGGNGTATSSMDLTALNNNDYATACTQAHTQVNTANKTQSNILLAPLKQVNHPVQVFSSTSSTGYQAILTWVNKE